MPRPHGKNQTLTAKTICFPRNPVTFTAVGAMKCTIAKAQDKDFEVAVLNMSTNLKENTSKSCNEDYEMNKKK